MLSESHFLLLREILKLKLPAGAGEGIQEDLRGETHALADGYGIVRRRAGDAPAVRQALARLLEQAQEHARTCPCCALLHPRGVAEGRAFVPCRRCLEQVPRDAAGGSAGAAPSPDEIAGGGDEEEEPGATFAAIGAGESEAQDTFVQGSPAGGGFDPDATPEYLSVVIPGAQDLPRRLPGRLVWTGAAGASGDALRIERWIGEDSSRWQVLLRHMESLARADHPAIARPQKQAKVTWFDARWMETRYLRPAGESLEVWLARGKRLPPDRALPLVASVGEILDACWKAGVRPSGISLDDLQVDAAGAVHLVPSGLPPEVFQGQDALYSPLGPLLGDFRLAPPEWWEGEEPSEAAGSFFLGAVLLGLLRGVPLFAGPNPLEAALAVARFRDDPSSALQVAGLDAALMDRIAPLLAPRPQDRPATIADARKLLASTPASVPAGGAAMPEGHDPRRTVPTPIPPPASAAGHPAAGSKKKEAGEKKKSTSVKMATRGGLAAPPPRKKPAAGRPGTTGKGKKSRAELSRKPRTSTPATASQAAAGRVLPPVRKRRAAKNLGVTLWILDAIVVALFATSYARNGYDLEHIRTSVTAIRALPPGREPWDASVSLAMGAVGKLREACLAGRELTVWPEPEAFWRAQWSRICPPPPAPRRLEPVAGSPGGPAETASPEGVRRDEAAIAASGVPGSAGESAVVETARMPETPSRIESSRRQPGRESPAESPSSPAAVLEPPASLTGCVPQLGATQPFLDDARIRTLVEAGRSRDRRAAGLPWADILPGDLETLVACLGEQVQAVHHTVSEGFAFPVIPDWLDPLLDSLAGSPDSRFGDLHSRALGVRDHLRLHVVARVIQDVLAAEADSAGEEGAAADLLGEGVHAPLILEPLLDRVRESRSLLGELHAVAPDDFASEVSKALRSPGEPEKWKLASRDAEALGAATQKVCLTLKALASDLNGLRSDARLADLCDVATLSALFDTMRDTVREAYRKARDSGKELVDDAYFTSKTYARRSAASNPDFLFHQEAMKTLKEIKDRVDLIDEVIP